MADGRHFEKNVKSPYLCDRSADFDEIWQDGAYWPKFMNDWIFFCTGGQDWEFSGNSEFS